MRVSVRLFADLGRYLPEGASGRTASLDLDDRGSVGQIVQRLGMPRDGSYLTLVNGKHATIATELSEGDTVSIFPPIAGGRGSAQG